MKICNKCGIEKDFSEFHKRKISKDGYRNQCKDCRNQYYHENSEKLSLKKKEYYKDNLEYFKESNKKYIQSDRGRKINKNKSAKRRALRNNATLEGYDSEIKDIYLNCPEGHHVDHIMPLNHPNLCGLHVPWNLQYLPAEENIRKSNKIIP